MDTKTYTGLTAVKRALGPLAAKPTPERNSQWSSEILTDLFAVEQLLDWLENNGFEERELEVAGNEFVVRWR